MKFLIYGAGAVGSYFGALLAQAQHEVVLVSRSTYARIEKNGLTVVRANQKTFNVKVQAVSSLRQALVLAEEAGKPYDYIFLTMKMYDLPTAIDELIAFCPDNPPMLVALQNGIGAEEKLTKHYPAEKVIAGSVTVPVSVDASFNVVEEKGGRGLGLAPVGGRGISKHLMQALKEAGIETVVVKNYLEMKWSKLLINVIGNATAAILNRRPGIVYKSTPLFRLEVRMLKEVLAVMKGLKLNVVNLPGMPATRLVFGLKWLPEPFLKPLMTNVVAGGRGDKAPSFHLDLIANKRKNEVLYHNGAVNLSGRELNIPTPVNAALTDILLQLVHEEIDSHKYDGNPKELLKSVNEYARRQKQGEIQE